MRFTSLMQDSSDFFFSESHFRIVSYVDSLGCISCKLRLLEWKNLMQELDSLFGKKVSVLFFMHPKIKKPLVQTLKRENFTYPICIDEEDSLNKLNHFPTDMAFQTFLLDKDNKVLAIGNPVHNPKVKELYLKIIRGDDVFSSEQQAVKTEIVFDKTSFSFGKFDWREEQKITFTLKNIGDKPLVVEGVSTSCGCTTVDYPKEPAQPGKSLVLVVTYKAEQPEHFNKTITVYCNAETSPVKLTISGNAE